MLSLNRQKVVKTLSTCPVFSSGFKDFKRQIRYITAKIIVITTKRAVQ